MAPKPAASSARRKSKSKNQNAAPHRAAPNPKNLTHDTGDACDIESSVETLDEEVLSKGEKDSGIESHTYRVKPSYLMHLFRIVGRNGLGFLIERARANRRKSQIHKALTVQDCETDEQTAARLPARLRKTLQELGPTFVKFGQMLSTRYDLLPPRYIGELEKLQDDVKPVPINQIRAEIETELGAPISSVFSHFEDTPIAAASIGQVHHARLKKTGEDVVVKVQRPNIRPVIHADIQALYVLAHLLNRRFKEMQYFNLVGAVEEFEKSIHLEMDYFFEARNIQRFRKQFEPEIREGKLVVPKVFWDLTTKRVLTMEYVGGVNLKSITDGKIATTTIEKKNISDAISSLFAKQILIHGFYHADPHPSNIRIISTGKKAQVAFIDFGMMGHLSAEVLMDFARMFDAIVTQDTESLVHQLANSRWVDTTIDTKSLRQDVMLLMDRYYDVSLKNIQVGEFINQVFKLFTKYKVKVPKDLVMLGRALLIMEGVCRKLDPEFNFATTAEPLSMSLVKKQFSAAAISKAVRQAYYDVESLIHTIPEGLRQIVRLLEQGKFKIELEHTNLSSLVNSINQASNRLSVSFIIAAIIVGSALIMQTNKGVQFLGFPLLGVTGFILSGVLGLWLVVSIMRSGRLIDGK